MRYLRDRWPSFSIPAYEGRRYEDLAPDTLDVQERIGLAVNGLTGPTDPDLDHMIYFAVTFRGHPPIMSHGKSDVCTSKFMEALPLMRLASGSGLNDHIDPVWMAAGLRMIGPGGLLYWPMSPYVKVPPDWCDPVPKGSRHFALPTWNGRMMGAMTAYMRRDPKGPWAQVCRGITDGLMRVAVREGNYAYFPHGAYVPGPNGPRHVKVAWKPFGIFSSLFGWCAAGLAQFYRASGYEPANDLGVKLSRFLAFHGEYFGPDGAYLPNDANRAWEANPKEFTAGPPPVSHHIHFQHHVTPLLGMTDAAILSGDRELKDFVVKAFEWGKKKGCDLVGYFPENIDDNSELECSETCEVAAMIGIALKLSAAGWGDYWDEADRWIRNQFAENQLLVPDWVYHVSKGEPMTSRVRVPLSAFEPGVATNDRVPERNVGAFAGWPTANDWFAGQGSGIMHCCTGNGTRTLYYIWEHILTCESGELSVNLLLNRPSRWADVHSHLPYAGQVDVRMKEPCRRLRVRVPGWADVSKVVCTVNGRKIAVRWEERYAVVEHPKAEDVFSFEFPISERAAAVDIEKRRYLLTLRGAEVVDIYPRGRYWPLYQRAYLRSSVTRWKKFRRYVPNEEIVW